MCEARVTADGSRGHPKPSRVFCGAQRLPCSHSPPFTPHFHCPSRGWGSADHLVYCSRWRPPVFSSGLGTECWKWKYTFICLLKRGSQNRSCLRRGKKANYWMIMGSSSPHVNEIHIYIKILLKKSNYPEYVIPLYKSPQMGTLWDIFFTYVPFSFIYEDSCNYAGPTRWSPTQNP